MVAEAVLCRVAQVTVAVPVGQVIETMRPLPIAPLGAPGATPPCVRGVARIRGAATLILDLGLVVGNTPSTAARLVTLRGPRPVALAVDDIVGVRPIDAGAAAIPVLGDTPAIAALGARDRELQIVLSTLRLVPAGVTW